MLKHNYYTFICMGASNCKKENRCACLVDMQEKETNVMLACPQDFGDAKWEKLNARRHMHVDANFLVDYEKSVGHCPVCTYEATIRWQESHIRSLEAMLNPKKIEEKS